jgi:Rrf2 family nitric oxide-sensitive transcriptional repressor
MKFTQYTDFALRVVVHLGTQEAGLSSIAEIARVYRISRNHLMKVVQDLGGVGYVETVRGRNGGIRLAKPIEEINVGALVRHTEGQFRLVQCSGCVIAPVCVLPTVFHEATDAFLDVLDKYSVADLLVQRDRLRELFAGHG